MDNFKKNEGEELVFYSDLWVDLKDYQRTVFWHEIYRYHERSSKHEYRYRIVICRKRHAPEETFSFNDAVYCLNFIGQEHVLRSDLGQIVYSEEAARQFSKSKMNALIRQKKRKGMTKLIDKNFFAEKVQETFNNFLNKYTEE